MLDQETKRRIDSCRNMLVGKIPDPKSQVEQITIALIYKFMDDMDNEAVEMGGKASFFTGDYAKYSWTAIFDPRIGGHDLLKLYGEALEKMNQNPNIPQLFRNIFNNAYLPYRDPETLKLFLKEIDNFHYSHSEKLGDAFEYLLSFMGTQGDAGQFRTPRHIIDFIAEVVDPKKNETVLDPACGTAGFMISAYKHILRNNDGGKELTPDERKRLINNFIGYDISPDMVRLSLVNLYLHGFQDPKIFEYDTLTSEERWDDTVDVILANPPFMTPKGGIRPHKRFAVQANRSEVLFVDYIAEHLNPGGRAGIIVPEGIIFQSSNAYKNLRKMLVDDYLWAVVSLPAGVFNPYSGVKTSILLLDKRKSKESDSILFVKVDNDGFGLGSQRRTIDKNDLPEALKILQSGDVENTEIAHWVEKSKIKESGDWNLSGGRYKDSDEIITDWDLIEIGQLAIVERGGSPRPIKEFITDDSNGVNWIKIGDVAEGEKYVTKTKEKIKKEGITKTRLVQNGDFILSNSMSYGRPYIVKIDGAIHDGWLLIRINESNQLNSDYLFSVLGSENIKKQYDKYATGGVVKNLNSKIVRGIQIPLPPLSVQEEIVAEIDGYQKIIDGARQVVENYKPTIKIDPEWEMVKLGEVCEKLFAGGDAPKEKSKTKTSEYNIPIYSNGVDEKSLYGYTNISKVNDDAVTISARGTIGFPQVRKAPFVPIVRLIVAIPKKEIINLHFLKYVLDTFTINRTGNTIPQLTIPMIKNEQIPLPPLSVQQEIVAQIEAEQEMVNANKKLIEIFEQKVKDKIGEVWGEE